MKAKCKRLAGRTHVVGTTPFEFDGEGICTVVPQGRGNVAVDFANLCKLNGVTDITHGDQNEGEPPEAPVEADAEPKKEKATKSEAKAEPAAKDDTGKTTATRRPARRKAKTKGDD